MNVRPFIPAWLDDAGLSAAEIRVFIHLCRRSENSSGIAWPSYAAMIEKTGLGKSTIRRAIEELERRGLIARLGKRFGGTCQYQILPSNSSTTGTIESPIVPPEGQLVSPNSASDETPIVPPQTRNSSISDPSIVPPEGHKGNPMKVLQRRESKEGKTSTSGLADAIWNLTPRMGRERSSRKQLVAALQRLPKGTSDEAILESLKAWVASESWTKDEGQFVPGIHRWVSQGKWENHPEPARLKGDPHTHRLGYRKSNRVNADDLPPATLADIYHDDIPAGGAPSESRRRGRNNPYGESTDISSL